ncbi:hypothetical protein KR084_005586, partial [Drosophila pseudotakahashii]
MKISLAVLGLFLAFFCGSQAPTSAIFQFPRPSTIFCKYFPNLSFCPAKDNDSGSGGSAGSSESSNGNGTAAAGSGNSTNATTQPVDK